MQTKENSFIKKFISSIKDFEKYPEMAIESFRSVCKYLITLIAIFTLIVTAVSVYDVSKDINNGIEYFKNEIPNLSFSNNRLTVEATEPIKLTNIPNVLDMLIIDTNELTNEQINSYESELQKHSTGAILLSDKVILNLGNGTITYTYEKLVQSYKIGDMTKETILNYLSGSNMIMIYVGIYIMSYIYLFIAYLISTLMDALILGVLGYITSLLMKIRIKFTAMLKISIHALTLPIILNLLYIIVQALFGFRIKYFEIMYIAVAYIYIVASILMIKSDIIKRGQELAKIVEEQEKVKQELERQKEEQRQKEEEERRKRQEEKEKKKREKKEKEKEGLSGETGQPQGENA